MIKLENINKYYNKGKKNELHVINDVSITLNKNGLVSLLGPSGSGKTTILNVIGGLDKIKKGNIYINGQKITHKTTSKIDKVRNLNIGYIFQDYKLIDDITVFDNIALVLKMIGIKDKKEINKRVNYVLEKLNIYRFRYRLASMLSGGERQRVGIARAIVKDPDIILADEPTGNLDSKNTIEIMNIIKSISKEKLVILVTHEVNLAYFYADQIIELSDGKVIKNYRNTNTGSLDYRIENNIYLKDIPKQEDIKINKNKIKLYIDNNDNINITLVVKNNNIYIESNNQKIEVIDNNSNIKLIDDHYREIKYDEINKYEFNFKNIINNNFKKKYSSIYRGLSYILSGFKKIKNYSLIKKILLLGFMASSMFIVFSLSRIASSNAYEDADFVKYNQTYVNISKGEFTYDDYLTLNKYSNINYIIPGSSIINLAINYDTYLQNYNMSYDTINGSIASSELLKKEDILIGNLPSNKNEIVLDKIVAQSLFKDYHSALQAGILTISDLIGIKTSFDNYSLEEKETFTIVGIVDLKSPSIYVTKDYLFDFVYKSNNFTETNFANFSNSKYTLKKGKNPTNDYEVVLSSNYLGIYEIGKNIDYKINDKKLKVVGFYEDNNQNVMYINQNMLIAETFKNFNEVMISSNDKKTLINELINKKYNASDTYLKSKDTYIEEREYIVKSTLIFSLIIIAISLIEIFLMVRSSFLSKVKEVGIYRAIGVKRKDIYKMFLGEIIAVNVIASIPGTLLMSYILYNVSKMKIVGSCILINPFIIIASIIVCFAFNIIVGLIPVYNCVRKTPANILARHDI